MHKKNESIETTIVHGDHRLDPLTGAVAPPLYPCSTFAFKNADQGAALFEDPLKGYFYTRISNPTNDIIRRKIAMLEGTDEGLAFGSGMAAIHAVIVAFTKSGDNVVVSDTVYGGTLKLLEEVLSRYNIETRWVNCLDLNEVENNIDKNTSFIFLETPANPTTIIYDIKRIAEITKRNNIPLIVDNTFMTPYLQKPIELGADVIIHSATKYIGGHGDVVAGLVACNNNYFEKIFHTLVEVGGIISPFDAWLLLRGLKTLHVRMDRHCENAMKVARYLENHQLVKKVFYPGLESHPQHQLAKQQMSGFGGIVTFEVEGGIEACKILQDNVHLFTLAVSLGDVDSLIQHPATMTHSSYTPEQLAKSGITKEMIRLSIGLENVDDIINDLDHALKKVSELLVRA